MRNPNKIQMKYEFKLDSRQSIMLLAAFLVILAFAFGLGVKTGKHFAKISQPEQTENFVDELKNKENNLEQARQEMAEDTQHQAAVEEPAVPAVEALPPPANGEAALVETQKAADQKAAEEKAAAEKAAQAEAEAAAEAEKAKKEAQKKKEEQAKKDAEKKSEPKKEEKTASDETKAPGGSYYTLQLASFPARDGADKFVKNFKPFDSRKPFITEVELADKGKWYRVKIGQFDSKEQAMAYQSIFEARTGRSTMIVLETK